MKKNKINYMSIKKIGKEYRDTPKSEILEAVFENFTYGILGSIIIVFITLRIDIAVLIAYMSYYFFVGKVVNRPKYVTSLGKFIVFPVPAALGAFIGYKLANLASIYF
jgi:hypothetical protein